MFVKVVVVILYIINY